MFAVLIWYVVMMLPHHPINNVFTWWGHLMYSDFEYMFNVIWRPPHLNTLLYESRCKLCKLSQEDVGSAYEDVSLWWNVLFVTSWRKSIKCLDFLFLRLLRRFFRFLSPITLPGMGCVMSWATQKEDTSDAIIVISSRYVTSKSEIFWVYIKFPNYNQNYVE